MACSSNRGELSQSALKMLAALEAPATPEDLAAHTELPLFRVRASLRELAESGLVELKDGAYATTQLGRTTLP